jgi:hypothetical protein
MSKGTRVVLTENGVEVAVRKEGAAGRDGRDVVGENVVEDGLLNGACSSWRIDAKDVYCVVEP